MCRRIKAAYRDVNCREMSLHLVWFSRTLSGEVAKRRSHICITGSLSSSDARTSWVATSGCHNIPEQCIWQKKKKFREGLEQLEGDKIFIPLRKMFIFGLLWSNMTHTYSFAHNQRLIRYERMFLPCCCGHWFWWWARSSSDPRRRLSRWGWRMPVYAAPDCSTPPRWRPPLAATCTSTRIKPPQCLWISHKPLAENAKTSIQTTIPSKDTLQMNCYFK